MANQISVAPYVLVASALALLGIGIYAGRSFFRATGDAPPPPFSELNELRIKDVRAGPDPLLASFSSSMKADGVEYDIDKGGIWVKDASDHEMVPVDATAVSNLLARFNTDVNVPGVPITLVPNVHEFYIEDGSPKPMDVRSVTVSWEFYITSNPDKPFSKSYEDTELKMPPG